MAWHTSGEHDRGAIDLDGLSTALLLGACQLKLLAQSQPGMHQQLLQQLSKKRTPVQQVNKWV